MERYTLEAILRAFNTTGKYQTRYEITHVKINAIDNNRIKLTSTNGHMLSEQVLIDENTFTQINTLGQPLMISNESKAIIKLMLKNKNSLFSFKEGLVTDGNLSFYCVDISACKSFPDTDQLFKVVPDNRIEITFNAEYLLAIDEALRNQKNSCITMVIDPTRQKLDPILLVGYQDGSQGLLMPMRK